MQTFYRVLLIYYTILVILLLYCIGLLQNGSRANRRYKNLPTANEVAIVIPNKHESVSYYNIVLADCGLPREPLWYYRISLNHAAYILLYYVLLFPYGDCGWH